MICKLANDNILKIEEVTRKQVLEVLTFLCYSQDLQETQNVNVNK
mgnify:CR=1 FL=1